MPLGGMNALIRKMRARGERIRKTGGEEYEVGNRRGDQTQRRRTQESKNESPNAINMNHSNLF
jgi:hypothetical protein